MESVAAFSLACGVMQVISFGTKVVSSMRQLQKDGSITGLNDIDNIAKQLRDLSTRLRVTNAQHTGEALDPAEQTLIKLATGCSKTADDLVRKLETLKPDKSGTKRRKRDVLRMGFRAVLSKDDIAAI